MNGRRRLMRGRLPVIATLIGIVAVCAPAMPLSAGEARGPKAEKKGGKGDEVIATVNGESVTRSAWSAIWKADQWFAAELKLKPGYAEKMAGRPYEDYFFREEVVKILGMSQKYGESLPAMKSAIDAVWTRATGGDDFADLAAQYSQDAGSAARGGALGEPQEFHELVFPFNRIAFGLDEGEISEPFLTVFGYHICRVDRIIPAGEGKGKRIEVRNILIRFPSPDARSESETLADGADVRVVDRKLCRKLVTYCTDA